MHFPTQASYKTMQSPWGQLTLAATAKGLCGVWFEQQQHFPTAHQWTLAPQNELLQQTEQRLNAYFSCAWQANESARHFLNAMPLDLSHGTVFQQAVWQALMDIPAGQTCCYGDLAHAIGRPNAVRAVGAAIGRNPISILIPCHRVIGRQGQLTGYAGGIWRKQALLQLENSSDLLTKTSPA